MSSPSAGFEWADFERTWLSQPELLDYREADGFAALAAFSTTA